jgi:ketosteroid isomerase-like protein
MKGLLFAIGATIICLSNASAQTNADVQSMVAAERAFASLASTSNTRNAFLAYLTDSTILFEKGIPVAGKKSWTERPADESLLSWEPVFAGISSDGKMGFSTGPVRWSKSKTATPEGFGFFASVWQKTSEGWKVAADIGISFPEDYNSRKLRLWQRPDPRNKTRQRITRADSIYSDALISANPAVIRSHQNAEAKMLRSGIWPYTVERLDEYAPQGIGQFEQHGCQLSDSGDLGFCYGSFVPKNAIETSTNDRKGYLRIFTIDAEGWKVVLDVIGGN